MGPRQNHFVSDPTRDQTQNACNMREAVLCRILCCALHAGQRPAELPAYSNVLRFLSLGFSPGSFSKSDTKPMQHEGGSFVSDFLLLFRQAGLPQNFLLVTWTIFFVDLCLIRDRIRHKMAPSAAETKIRHKLVL